MRPPSAWFAEATEVGLGAELELAAIRAALQRLDEFPSDVALAINVSPTTALDPRFCELLLDVADRLVIEITEHAQVDDYDALRSALAPLRERGAQLAIDDVGAGFSNLRHILRLAPDILKLDLSLTQEIANDPAREALLRAEDSSCRLLLPTDLVIADSFDAGAKTRVTDDAAVPTGWIGLDVGPRTREQYAIEIAAAGTVFWNGPMGLFEDDRFASGTRAVAEAMARTHAFTVVGGGDSAAALTKFGLDDEVDHVSTGGGASLEYLEKGDLPGLEALRKAPNAPREG